MSFIDKWKHERAYKHAAEAKIKKAKQAAYYQAKEKESIIEAQQHAKIEREQKVKSYRSQGTGNSFSRAMGGIAKSLDEQAKKAPKRKAPSSMGMGSIMGSDLSYITGAKPKVKAKPRKKRSTKRKKGKR